MKWLGLHTWMRNMRFDSVVGADPQVGHAV